MPPGLRVRSRVRSAGSEKVVEKGVLPILYWRVVASQADPCIEANSFISM